MYQCVIRPKVQFAPEFSFNIRSWLLFSEYSTQRWFFTKKYSID